MLYPIIQEIINFHLNATDASPVNFKNWKTINKGLEDTLVYKCNKLVNEREPACH